MRHAAVGRASVDGALPTAPTFEEVEPRPDQALYDR